MQKLFDLRFVIGLFFLIIGILLMIHGIAFSPAGAANINLYCGLLMGLFGGIMIVLSFRKK